jgi:hypothetical protein
LDLHLRFSFIHILFSVFFK